MPPKKASNDPSKKTVEKQKAKIIEDKTFGLKNKKGSKQQKFIQTIEKQVKSGGPKTEKDRLAEKAKLEKETKKDEKQKQLDELTQLFKPIVETQKVGQGVDPKSVVCVFFKQGLCRKAADKCKFSHDLNIARKSERRNMFEGDEACSSADMNGEGGSVAETMENWDQAKLEEVVHKKHDDQNKGLPTTTIICKFFLSAVEADKYGWFWECPNGLKCHYRHALPPDFVLKRDKKKLDDDEVKITLEELIENERMALGPEQTKITYDSFIKWKRRKKAELKAKMENEKAKRKDDFKSGRITGISGREMFEFNPDFVKESALEGDDGTGDIFDSSLLAREKDDADNYEGPIREINFNDFEMGDEEIIDENQFPANVEVDEALFNDEELDDLDDELEGVSLDS